MHTAVKTDIHGLDILQSLKNYKHLKEFKRVTVSKFPMLNPTQLVCLWTQTWELICVTYIVNETNLSSPVVT